MAASVLYEVDRFDEAIVWLERALCWNPASPALYFELGENYKRKGDFHKAETCADKGYPYSYRTVQLAKYLRTKGFCNVEYGNFKLAVAFFMASLLYKSSELALSEIMYMKVQYGADYADMTPEQAMVVLEESNMPYGAHEDTLKTFCTVLSNSLEAEDYPVAAQCAFVLYQLTRDEECKKILKVHITRKWYRDSTKMGTVILS